MQDPLAIQREMQDPLALAILNGIFREGETVVVAEEREKWVCRKQ